MFVKICGVTTPEDGLLAAGLGADALGLNFVAASPRIISTRLAAEIVRRVPPDVLSVGVFRNERPERVVQIANEVGLRAVQLHGEEPPEDVVWVGERVPNVIRALPAASLDRYDLEGCGPVRLLVDAPEPGSGKVFDWERLAASPPDRPFLLAGGLRPDNVVDAIRLLRPWGVDLASGVESRPGVKDPVKLQQFIAAARSVTDLGDDPAPALFT